MTATDTWVDRNGWPSGAWDTEPDRAEWRDETTGLPCLALRHARMGHWCGYVAVPPGHPWHGLDYDSIDDAAHGAAHGGLTFAAACMEDDRPLRERVCHVPLPGESDDVWWLGFDCAHAGDLSPGMRALARDFDLRGTARDSYDKYKTLTYVQSRCAELAHAVAERSS